MNERFAVRATQVGSTITFEGMAMIFDSRDLYDTVFTSRTRLFFQDGDNRPAFAEHGLDERWRDRIGWAEIERVEGGVRGTLTVNLDDLSQPEAEYALAAKKLASEGRVGFSTGTAERFVDVDERTGEVLSWPIMELSLTATPGEPKILSTMNVRALSLDEAQEQEHEVEDAEEGEDSGVSDIIEIEGEPETHQSDENAEAEAGAEAPAPDEDSDDGDDSEEPTVKRNVNIHNISEDTMSEKDLQELAARVGGIEEIVRQFAEQYSANREPAVNEDAKRIRAFNAFLHMQREFDGGESVRAALSQSGEGASLLPQVLANEIYSALDYSVAVIEAGANVVTRKKGQKITLPILGMPDAVTIGAEGDNYVESEPDATSVTFNNYKIPAYATVHQELVDLSDFDIAGQVVMPHWKAMFLVSEDALFTTGTGSSQPEGVVEGAGAGVTTASATAVTMDEVTELLRSVTHPLYTRNKSLMMNENILGELEKLDSDQNFGHIKYDNDGNAYFRGTRIFLNNSMADTLEADAKVMLCGDFSAYTIVRFGEIKYLVNPYRTDYAIRYRAYEYVDGHVMDSDGIKVLQCASG